MGVVTNTHVVNSGVHTQQSDMATRASVPLSPAPAPAAAAAASASSSESSPLSVPPMPTWAYVRYSRPESSRYACTLPSERPQNTVFCPARRTAVTCQHMHELSALLLVCDHGPASTPHLRAFLYFISFIGVICKPTRPCTSSCCLGGLCAVNGSQLPEAQTNEPHATHGTNCEVSAHSQYKRREQRDSVHTSSHWC